MQMNNWIAFLYIWNIVNQPYFSKTKNQKTHEYHSPSHNFLFSAVYLALQLLISGWLCVSFLIVGKHQTFINQIVIAVFMCACSRSHPGFFFFFFLKIKKTKNPKTSVCQKLIATWPPDDAASGHQGCVLLDLWDPFYRAQCRVSTQ